MTSFLYNPDRKSKDQLIAEFVVRTGMLEEIMHDLETSDMKTPEQHYLLVGQRGTGKTTLLNRIKYAIEDSQKLKDWLIPVIFSEEQYNISELADLWESVAHILEDYHDFLGISKEMEQHASKPNFEELCYDILQAHLDVKQKKLVLLIDNIGDLFKKLTDVEVRRLREILQTKSHIRLIAGSPFYLDSILDYKQPFFEFFKIKKLEGLNKGDCKELLLKLGEVFNVTDKIERIILETPERVETLRVLTGGIPRTIALMFRIFIDHEHESSMRDLERVLDAVTPLYKHRMDDLPKQQQKIVDAVARNWDAISVKELKDKTRIESKVLSAQLRQLEKNQIVEKITTSTKNHIYLLRERFWNIWYLMRYGRKSDTERVIWLVRFLESWCSDKDIEIRINNFIGKIRDNVMTGDDISFFSQLYSSFKQLAPRVKQLLKKSLPLEYSKKIGISDPELTTLVKDNFSEAKYLEAIDLICELETLEPTEKVIFMECFNLILKSENGQEKMKQAFELVSNKFIEIIEGKRHNESTSLSLNLLATSYVILYTIYHNLEEKKYENAIEALQALISSVATVIYMSKKKNNLDDLRLEIKVVAKVIQALYKKELGETIVKIFEETQVEVEEKPIFAKDVLEPIYLSLKLLMGKVRVENIPNEKTELIQDIATFIKEK